MSITLSVSAFAGCGGGSGDDPGAACLDEGRLDLQCAPLFDPSLPELHARTLGPTCASSDFCHSDAGRAGGLALHTEEAAFDGLVAAGRVDPQAPDCSLLLTRLYATDSAEVMPPGLPLPDPERCVILRWIAAGAPR